MNEEIEAFYKKAFETRSGMFDSLIFAFIKETGLKPEEIELVSEQDGLLITHYYAKRHDLSGDKMEEPKKKVDILVQSTNKLGRQIIFFCSESASRIFRKFGTLRPMDLDNQYMLVVDPRYDFEEVLQYVTSYVNIY